MYCRWCLCSPNYLCSPAKHQLAAKVVSTGNFSLLGCVTVLMGVSFPVLRRIVVSSSSESSIPITPQCLALNMNVVQSFKTLGITQSYIPEYLSLQQHQCCENLKFPIISTDSTITFSTTNKGQGRGGWKQCQWTGLWRFLQFMKWWNCQGPRPWHKMPHALITAYLSYWKANDIFAQCTTALHFRLLNY